MNSLDPWRTIVTDPSGEVIAPSPSYGHPFYREVPSWIHYGNDASTHRQLFDGVFVGADPTGPLAGPPPSAPAPGGITVRKELDDKQVLHVEICVDGKCYKTSMDLAPAIAMVMAKLARWHEAQHAAQQVPPTVVVGAIENAIGAAGDTMADMLVDHHVAVMMGSWLDDVGNAIGGTIRKLQPVISTVATGVATAFGGPAAGAAAGKLVPMWTGLQADLLDPKGDPNKKAAAAQAIQRVNQVAATSPLAAQALSAAHQAVKHTTVAYHVKETAQKAAAGDAAAQSDINQILQAAQQGDPAAKSTADVLASAFAQSLLDRAQHSDLGAQLWEKITGAGQGTVSSGWYPSHVGAAPYYGSILGAIPYYG